MKKILFLLLIGFLTAGLGISLAYIIKGKLPPLPFITNNLNQKIYINNADKKMTVSAKADAEKAKNITDSLNLFSPNGLVDPSINSQKAQITITKINVFLEDKEQENVLTRTGKEKQEYLSYKIDISPDKSLNVHIHVNYLLNEGKLDKEQFRQRTEQTFNFLITYILARFSTKYTNYSVNKINEIAWELIKKNPQAFIKIEKL